MTDTETTHAKAVEWVRPLSGMLCYLPIYEDRESEVMEGGMRLNVRVRESGIALADNVDNEEIEGLVVAIGEGAGEPISDRLAWALVETMLNSLGLGKDRVHQGLKPSLARDLQRAADSIRIPFDVKVGDRILVEPWGCTVVTLADIDYHVCSERSVVGIIPPSVENTGVA